MSTPTALAWMQGSLHAQPNAQHRARQRLLNYAQAQPGAWGFIEQAHVESMAAGVARTVYASSEFTARALRRFYAHHGLGEEFEQLSASDKAGAKVREQWLRVFGAWRMGQGIYRIDPRLYESLAQTELKGPIPSHILSRLPEWCPYIETPGMQFVDGPEMHGAWVCPDVDDNGVPALTVALDFDGATGSEIITLSLQGTLEQAVQRALSPHELDMPGNVASWLEVLSLVINLALYIGWCNDISGVHGQPANPQPKKVKGGEKIFAASTSRFWSVGMRLGAALEAAQQKIAAAREERSLPERARQPVGPHVRKPHWHSYWLGTGSCRRIDVRWMPPIPVNWTEIDYLPAIVHSVH